MPLLEISRDSGYADRARSYTVVIDGIAVGKVRNGETKQFEVSAGDHELRMKIDWCGSRPIHFSVPEGGVASFNARSGLRDSGSLGALGHAFFARDSWVILTPAEQETAE
jgi:hypothetical protein